MPNLRLIALVITLIAVSLVAAAGLRSGSAIGLVALLSIAFWSHIGWIEWEVFAAAATGFVAWIALLSPGVR